MKILHIWNTAAVGSVIAKFMDRIYGTRSIVVMRKQFCKFDFDSYYAKNTLAWDCGSKLFTLKALMKAYGVDIIHVHAFDKIIPYLHFLYDKPICLTYHGSDIRFHWNEHQKYWKHANRIFYVTEEMKASTMPKHAILFKNPVDTDLFFKTSIQNNGKAFHISYFADDLAKEYAKNFGLELTIHDSKLSPIPHSQLADVLRQYEYYIDVKRIDDFSKKSKVIGRELLGKLGLEALACGLKVVNWNGEVIEGLPKENMPENVCKKLYETYCEVLH